MRIAPGKRGIERCPGKQRAGKTTTTHDARGLEAIDAIRQETATMRTSYSRRRGDFVYDVQTYEDSGRHFARVVNLERLDADRTVSISADLPHAHGVTVGEAFAQLEAVVEAWIQEQTRPRTPSTQAGT